MRLLENPHVAWLGATYDDEGSYRPQSRDEQHALIQGAVAKADPEAGKEYAEILKEDPGAPVAGISCPLMQLAKAIGSWCRPFN